MRHRPLLLLLGAMLIAWGLYERGWLVLVIWPGCNFVILGIAHSVGAHGVFGKRPDGSLPLWSWALFLPLLIYTIMVWYFIRLFLRGPAFNSVTDWLVVGRRLSGLEIQNDLDNYVDLTAEFHEPAAIRHSPAYTNFPVLDGAAPTPDALAQAIDRLRPGKTFVHCAQGHGRTGLFALALLLKSGQARDVEEGLRLLKAVRPRVNLNRAQRACIESFARRLITTPHGRGRTSDDEPLLDKA